MSLLGGAWQERVLASLARRVLRGCSEEEQEVFLRMSILAAVLIPSLGEAKCLRLEAGRPELQDIG